MDTNHRILVVSEDSGNLDRIGKHLSERQYDVRCAADATEAIAAYSEWHADLVVTDYQLTRMHGLELIEAIRKLNPRARFILITPPGETPELMRATRSRIVAYLGKPFSAEDLMHYVRGAFNLGEAHVNRREFVRYPFTVETHCILVNPFDDSESRPLAALMRDISRSGISMIVRQIMPVPALIKIVLHLPTQQQSVTMLAKSVSCTLTQITGVYRLGAKFIGLLPREMEQIVADLSESGEGVAAADIYMGKSFKEAVREWFAQHHEKFCNESVDINQTLADMSVNVHGNLTDESGNGQSGGAGGPTPHDRLCF